MNNRIIIGQVFLPVSYQSRYLSDVTWALTSFQSFAMIMVDLICYHGLYLIEINGLEK